MAKIEDTAEEEKALEAEAAALEAGTHAEAEPPVEAETPEEHAEEIKAEEAARGEEPRDEKPKPPDGMVPHEAMHKERMGRYAERDARLAAEKKAEELQKRIEALENPPAAPPEYVDPLVDPEGFKKFDDYRNRTISEQLDQIKQANQQREQQAQRYNEALRFEAQAKQKLPDYDAAMRHLAQTRTQQLVAQGYAPEQVERQVVADANAVFDSGMAMGQNPAELLYWQAQQMGYKPARGNSEAEKIVALDKAQKATQGSGATGAPQAGKYTIAQLSAMSEADLAKVSDDEIRRVMGG